MQNYVEKPQLDRRFRDYPKRSAQTSGSPASATIDSGTPRRVTCPASMPCEHAMRPLGLDELDLDDGRPRLVHTGHAPARHRLEREQRHRRRTLLLGAAFGVAFGAALGRGQNVHLCR